MSPLWIPLLPLLAVQGLVVRRRVQRLPEATGPREGREGRGSPLRLLVLGDSAAAGVGAPHQRWALAGQLAAALSEQHALQWRLLAWSGARTAEATARLDAHADEPYDVVLTSLGVNDAVAGLSPARFAAQQAELFALLRGRHRARLVVASGLPPLHRFPALPQPLRAFLGARAAALDAALGELAAQLPGVAHLRLSDLPLDASAMAEDGFHPGLPAYRAWAMAAHARIEGAPELTPDEALRA
jgi:lysophospholipase L1-like esterase